MEKLPVALLCAFGLEGVVKSELMHMGFENLNTENGRVNLSASPEEIARFNLCLRTADRVVLPLAKFRAETFDELFEGAAKIDFPFPKNARIMVSGKSVRSKLSAFEVAASVVKKALIDGVCKKFYVDRLEGTIEYKLTVSIREDEAEIYLDTTGQGLSFRGYRRLNGEAALRETLAAALVILSRYRSEFPLVDPFCGTGTIPIEAGLYANNVPPNLGGSFDFEKWKGFFGAEEMSKLRERLKEGISDKPLKLFGFDINPEAVSMARYHAGLAGVKVHFQQREVKDLASVSKEGLVLTNPPYGERISDKREAADLLKTLSERFKRLGDWSLGVITPEREFERLANLSCRRRKLYNGGIECCFYQYWRQRKKEENPAGEPWKKS